MFGAEFVKADPPPHCWFSKSSIVGAFFRGASRVPASHEIPWVLGTCWKGSKQLRFRDFAMGFRTLTRGCEEELLTCS